MTNKCGWVDANCNSVTSVCNMVTSAHSSQYQYFAGATRECYAPSLGTMIIRVDEQASCNFHRMV